MNVTILSKFKAKTIQEVLKIEDTGTGYAIEPANGLNKFFPYEEVDDILIRIEKP